MSGRRSRNKGSRGERELAAELTRITGHPFGRTAQRTGKLGDSDVVSESLRWHVESKRSEKLNLYAALDQAIGDCKEGNLPLVAHRKNGKPWVAIIRLDDLVLLAKTLLEGKTHD